MFKSEFRNTHFSYVMGEDGIERFVSPPELGSADAIDPDPLPLGQVWGIGPGGADSGPALYRIEVTTGPGSGVTILNAPVPQAFRESARYAEQNLYTRARELVGDRDPCAHEFSVQLRAMDHDRSGASLGLPALLALCGALLEESLKGGLIVVGALNLGGSVEPLANAVGSRRSRRREGSRHGAGSGIGAQTTVRPVRRHGDEGQSAVLRRRSRCAVEGAVGIGHR